MIPLSVQRRLFGNGDGGDASRNISYGAALRRKRGVPVVRF
jgi:hypothetical protein